METPEIPVRLSLRWSLRDRSLADHGAETRDRAIVVRVRDNGPGIAAADLPHIFDRFYKGTASTGSGLGLTIARSLVIAHRGAITAESHLGAGTTVIVTLPGPRGQTPS